MVKWESMFAVGVPSMDRQHEELFRRANEFFQSINDREDEALTAAMLYYLENYVDLHFSSEESYMERVGFPERGEHVGEHLYFKQTFEVCKKKFEAGGAEAEQALLQLYDLIDNWLRDHILVTDQKLGYFLKKENRAELKEGLA